MSDCWMLLKQSSFSIDIKMFFRALKFNIHILSADKIDISNHFNSILIA